MQDDLLDHLFISSDMESSNEIVVPKKCTLCKTSFVCTIISAFINISKIGIQLSIDKCPYFQSFQEK